MSKKKLLAENLYGILKLHQADLNVSAEDISALLETPKDINLGDLAFPCFILAKELKKSPQQIAQTLAGKCQDFIDSSNEFSAVTATGPYLNFSFNKALFAGEIISEILSGKFTERRPSQEDKVMIEFSQPNTHKEFHVGHIRCASLGDSIVRIFDWCGHETIPVNYLGDEGTHVSKCLWYYTQIYQGEEPTEKKGEFLGRMYSNANDLLDLSALSKAPYEGVTAAKVTEISTHPNNPAWLVVKLDTFAGEKIVVTGVAGFSKDNIVPYAQPGTKLGDKTVTLVEKKGILSEGMLCAAAEIGLSDDNSSVLVLDENVPVGTEVANLFPTEEVSADLKPLEI
ncbi:MAG: arginine--tRNA ligase [Bdellovibrionales bacterium]|nr:arginine--tRNA ligase [Bdellovibrionales bacterium]